MFASNVPGSIFTNIQPGDPFDLASDIYAIGFAAAGKIFGALPATKNFVIGTVDTGSSPPTIDFGTQSFTAIATSLLLAPIDAFNHSPSAWTYSAVGDAIVAPETVVRVDSNVNSIDPQQQTKFGNAVANAIGGSRLVSGALVTYQWIDASYPGDQSPAGAFFAYSAFLAFH